MNAKWIETTEGYRFCYEGNNAVAIFVSDEGSVTEVMISSDEITFFYDFKEWDVYSQPYSLDHRCFEEAGIVYAGIFNESDRDWLIAQTLECVSGSSFDVAILLSRNISLIAKPISKGGRE